MLEVKDNMPVVPDGLMQSILQAIQSITAPVKKSHDSVNNVEEKIVRVISEIKNMSESDIVAKYPMVKHLSKFATFAMSGKQLDEETKSVIEDAIAQQRFSVDFFVYMLILQVMHEIPDLMHKTVKLDKVFDILVQNSLLDNDQLLKYYALINQRIQYFVGFMERHSSNAPLDGELINKLLFAMNREGKEVSESIAKQLSTIPPRSREKIRNLVAKLTHNDQKVVLVNEQPTEDKPLEHQEPAPE
jgi:hypothetical protein